MEWLIWDGVAEQGCTGLGEGEMLGYSQAVRSSIGVAVHLLCATGPKESYCVQVPARHWGS